MKGLLPATFVTLLICSICIGAVQGRPTRDDSYKGKTIMAIFAHPDDETSVSPVLARYAKKGANVFLVVATDGSKGVEPHANIPAGEMLAKARAEETRCVSNALGINPPILLNYPDGELALWDNIFSLDDRITELFSKHQPDVVLTWGSDGGYGHPDHRMVSNIVTEVFQRGDWESIERLLYVGFLKEELVSAPELKTEQGKWYRDTFKTTRKTSLTYRIPFDEKDRRAGVEAVRCHKTQFVPALMEDLSDLLWHDRLIYFRPWNGSDKIRKDILD